MLIIKLITVYLLFIILIETNLKKSELSNLIYYVY